MAKIRIKKERDFSVVPNAILRDTRLSPKARFMLIFCLSLADEWEYNIRGLATVMGCGVEAVSSGLKELEECRYLQREQKHVKGGRFGGNDYILYEKPYEDIPYTENPLTVIPDTDAPNTENQGQYNTIDIKNQYNKEKNKKRTQKDFIPPTLEQVEAFIKENSFNVNAQEFYKFYSSCGWKDSNERLVKNWKNKMRRVWVKDEPKPKPKVVSQAEQDIIDKSLSMSFEEEQELYERQLAEQRKNVK